MPTTTKPARRLLVTDTEARAFAVGATQLRRVCVEALSMRWGVPADAVCRGTDGTWFAWWGRGEPTCGWQAYTATLYPGGGGFPCPFGVPGDRVLIVDVVHTVASVRVERLQAVDNLDVVLMEVVPRVDKPSPPCTDPWDDFDQIFVEPWRDRWDATHPERQRWDDNPWVWVGDFKQEGTP